MDFYKGMAIHCPKYRDAKNLLDELERQGFKWTSGDPISYSNYIDFYTYGEKTHIFIMSDGIMYGNDSYLDGYEIYEFSDGVLIRENMDVCVGSKEREALQYALDILKEYLSSAGYDEKAIEAEAVLTELINKLKVDSD